MYKIHLLQAPSLDHHGPPIARHGEHFEAGLAQINSDGSFTLSRLFL